MVLLKQAVPQIVKKVAKQLKDKSVKARQVCLPGPLPPSPLPSSLLNCKPAGRA